MDAAGLVKKWLGELHKLRAGPDEKLEEWIKGAFSTYDSKNAALLYAEVFERRHPSPVDRQREIEMICANGEPAYGYATLAQLLSHKDYGRHCNTILTTNFDDLIADALYLYGERHARPLVVTHEALARYVRTNSPRPTVVKLHGDAHLDPKNLRPERLEIGKIVCDQLYPFLQNQALIFVGYGGNDESILKFVQNCPIPALAPPIYWISKLEAPAPFTEWLEERSAVRVDHTDFDQLMHLIRGALGIVLLDEKRWARIGEVYYRAFERLKGEIEGSPTVSDDAKALIQTTAEIQKSLPEDWNYYLRASKQQKSNPKLAKKYYQEGLSRLPDSEILNGAYAAFLYSTEQDLESAEEHFKRTIEINPRNPVHLGNYAIFLKNFRGDVEGAETHFKRAMEANPNIAANLANYGAFLSTVREDADGAESYYKRAIELEPRNATILASYARFLYRFRKNNEASEHYYKQAHEIDPDNEETLFGYAVYLFETRKDIDTSESFLKQALKSDPNNSNYLGTYANFLRNYRGDMKSAEVYYKRTLEITPEGSNALGNYAQLVLGLGRNAEGLTLLDRAFAARKYIRDDLLVELLIYRYAHDTARCNEALRMLKEAFMTRARTPGWSFAITLERAAKDKHPNLALLGDIVRVANDEAELVSLDKHEAWRSV